MVLDFVFIIIIVILLILNILIRIMGKQAQKVSNGSGLSGFEIARQISSRLSPNEPHIIKKNGKYLDHYNQERNVIKLSPLVFDGEDLYASLVAINIALETAKERKTGCIIRKLNSFLVIASYIMIFLGAFANNILVIRLGMILFILSFLIEFILVSTFLRNKEEMAKLYNLIKKENLIKPTAKYKDYFTVLSFLHLATLPYSFINYFR